MEASEQERPTLVETCVEGFLDDGSGLSNDTRQELRDATRGLVDAARSAPTLSGKEVWGVQVLVDDAVHCWLPEVLLACGAEDFLVQDLESTGPVRDEQSAREAEQGARATHPHTETVIEKAACSHAAQAAAAMARAYPAAAADDMQTAAHNAGRVLSELVVAGETERAITLLGQATSEALELMGGSDEDESPSH